MKEILKMIKIFVMKIQAQKNTEIDQNLCDEPTSMKEIRKMIKIFVMNIQA